VTDSRNTSRDTSPIAQRSATWRGIHAVMVTPFNRDQSVDYVGLSALVEFLATSPVDVIICLGSEGEFYALTDAERMNVAEVTSKALRGRRPLVVGVSDSSLVRSVSLARHAAEIGVGAVLSTPPYFGQPSASAVLDHFRGIAEVGLPVFAYNSPARQGYSLTLDTILATLALPGVIGVKQAAADILDLVALVEQSDRVVVGGSEIAIWPALCVGAAGNTATAASVIPGAFSSIWEAHEAGNPAAGLARYRTLAPLRAAYKLAGGQAAVVKRLLGMAGLPGGPVRPPSRQVEDSVDHVLVPLVERLKVDGSWPPPPTS